LSDTRAPARWRAYALVAPALAVIALFFVFPLILSAVLAFRNTGGGFTWEHFAKAWDLYQKDLMFTIGIVLLSTVLIGVVAVAIAGYLTLGENKRAVAIITADIIVRLGLKRNRSQRFMSHPRDMKMSLALTIEILLAQITVPALEQNREEAKFVFLA